MYKVIKNGTEKMCSAEETEAMIKDYFKMKPDEFLAITVDQGSNFPQIEAFLEVEHEEGIKCTVLKTATPPGQSKAA